jgi:predicted PurR-regulated permease PerM
MPTTPRSELKQSFLWLALGLVGAALLLLLGPVLTPFLAAAILAYVLNPAVDALERLRLQRPLAVLLVLLGLGLVLAAIALIVVPILTDELPLLRQRLPTLLAKIDNSIGPWLRQMGLGGRLDFPALQQALASKLAGNDGTGAAILTWLRVGGSALLGWVATLVLIPIALFYLLLDWHSFIQRIAETIPRRWIPLVTDMAVEVDTLLAQYLRGQLLVMLLLAAYYASALSIAGFDVALPVGLLTGLLVFIPYIGFGLGLALAIIAAVLQFDGWQGLIIVAGVYGFGQFIESFFLTPRLVGERIGLHPLIVIFALLAFGQLFGFVGILLGLPASAILSVGFARLRRHYLNSPFYKQT